MKHIFTFALLILTLQQALTYSALPLNVISDQDMLKKLLKEEQGPRLNWRARYAAMQFAKKIHNLFSRFPLIDDNKLTLYTESLLIARFMEIPIETLIDELIAYSIINNETDFYVFCLSNNISLSEESIDFYRRKLINLYILDETLQYAVERGDIEKAETCLSQGARVNARTHSFQAIEPITRKETSLMSSAFRGQPMMIDLFLAQPRVLINIQSSYEHMTALMYAASTNRRTTMTLLLTQCDIDLNPRNKKGESAQDLHNKAVLEDQEKEGSCTLL